MDRLQTLKGKVSDFEKKYKEVASELKLLREQPKRRVKKYVGEVSYELYLDGITIRAHLTALRWTSPSQEVQAQFEAIHTKFAQVMNELKAVSERYDRQRVADIDKEYNKSMAKINKKYAKAARIRGRETDLASSFGLGGLIAESLFGDFFD